MSNAPGPPPGFFFRQPFQANQGFSGSITPEIPLSPRAGHPMIPTGAGIGHGQQGGEGIFSGAYGGPPFQGFLNTPIGHGAGDHHWGAFPPRPMWSPFPTTDAYHRDSTTSIGHEVPLSFGGHGEGLFGPPNMRA